MYIKVKYLNKKEVSPNELEFQVIDEDTDVSFYINGKDIELGEYKSKESIIDSLDLSDIKDIIDDRDYTADDLEIDEDDYIEHYFENKNLEDIIDDQDYENHEVGNYIKKQTEKGKKSILDFFDEQFLLDQVSKLGHVIVS
jgi:hypothetical protein